MMNKPIVEKARKPDKAPKKKEPTIIKGNKEKKSKSKDSKSRPKEVQYATLNVLQRHYKQ